MADKTNLISVMTILSFVSIIVTLMVMTACRSLQTPRCEIDAEKMQKEKCYPITSYQKWNECVSTCENTSEKPAEWRTKSQPYEKKAWVRPRPYVYP